MRFFGAWAIAALLYTNFASAQLPDEDWEFEDAYRDQMLYLHALVNYSYDLQWELDWERRQFTGNALRVNTGSTSSDTLLTDIQLRVNERLNDEWRFSGSFDRDGFRQRPDQDEQLLLGFERSILESSALYLTVNPEFNKGFIDVAAGYTFYADNFEQYLRIGIFLEDLSYDSKNDVGGTTDENPVALQWAVRLPIAQDWFVYSEGEVGTGFERVFSDPMKSPDISRHDRRENKARLRLSRSAKDDTAWSFWVDWYDFNDAMQFRQPGFDYDYSNTQLNLAAEHIRVIRDRHRLRFLLHYVDQQAESRGFNEHDYERTDVFGGVFYERLWPNSGAIFAYAFGQPDIDYLATDSGDDYALDDYRDKIIAAWRYRFSENAQIRLSISHEVSAKGFGGGAVQFQMFF